jgi:chromosome segregation ATPase
LADPRLTVTPEDLRGQFDLRRGIRDQVDGVHRSINQIRRLRKQVESWEERAKADDGQERHKNLIEAATTLKEKLSVLEGELINSNADKPQPGPAQPKEKLATLSAMVDESDDVPTQGALEVYALLSEQVGSVQRRIQELLDGDVAAFNELVRATGLPAVGG